MTFQDLDGVTFTAPVVYDDRTWPAGTLGTIVDPDDRGAWVEIVDRHGHVDLVAAPYDALRVDVPAAGS